MLKAWLHRHSDHPFPSEKEKEQLCHATGLSMNQVTNWMVNVSHFCIPLSDILPAHYLNQQARRRILAPARPSTNASDPISSSVARSSELPVGTMPANIGIAPLSFYGAQDPRPVSSYKNQLEHSPKDEKTGFYKSKLCRSWEEKGSCQYGAKCQFLHGKDELQSVFRHTKVNVSCQCY